MLMSVVIVMKLNVVFTLSSQDLIKNMLKYIL